MRHIPVIVHWLATALLLLALTGCEPPSSHQFAIYLLAEDLSGSELLEATPESVQLRDEALITTTDIVSYNAETHEILLTASAYERVQGVFTLPVDVDGIGFAVALGRDPVYLGAFWTPLSSLSFDGVVIMQPFSPTDHTIQISRGYPGPDFVTGPDPRSDPRLMQALRQAGRLRGQVPESSPTRRSVLAPHYGHSQPTSS